ncbi:MAG TPA: hypothetical protein VHO29_15065 [Marmoricola sp.]|nr:hypothetical protein [Marmoricola sp.]
MAQDVQEDLAVELARELELDGTCVRVVPAIPPQRAVDVSWAAKRAGRLIGEHVRTSVTPLSSSPLTEVAVVAVVEQRRPRTIVEQRRPSS